MAKRKGKKRTATRRRSKVGALALNAKSTIVQVGPVVVGFLAGDKINAAIDKATGTMDAKLVGAGTAGIGAGLMFMKLGKKKTVPEVVAGGVLIGAGVKRLLKEFGIMNGIGGYGQVPVIGRSRVNGYGQVPVIGSGFQPSTSLNGVFNGYKVPRPPQIMGSLATDSGSGSGINNSSGGECMAA